MKLCDTLNNSLFSTLLKLYFGMGVLLSIAAYFQETFSEETFGGLLLFIKSNSYFC